jgi:hypothetical protein
MVLAGIGWLLGGFGLGTIGGPMLEPWTRHLKNFMEASARSQLLTPEQVIYAYWRGIITDKKWVMDELAMHGWSEERINYLMKVMEYFPTPSDLIRFAIREVYTPEILAKFQQLGDLYELDETGNPKRDEEGRPIRTAMGEKFLTEAAKAGLPEEQAANYWAAHWELPSPTQGFEMLHRGVITKKELETLLRALDVMPYWRDKLIAISYSPLTRVDARRAWELEVITDEELYKTYLALGYSPEDAERLTTYTKLERTLPYLREAYKKGWITSEQFKAELMALGIKPEVVEKVYRRVVTADKAERTGKERDLTKTEIIKGLKAGIISEADAYEMLQGLGYDRDEAAYLLYIYGVVEKGDPETPLEMRAVVERFKKMRGEKAMEITPEMIELDKQIKELKERIEKLKSEGKFDEAGLLAGELSDKEYRLRQLMIAAKS